MTLPSFRSMYLVKGTLLVIGVWALIMWVLTMTITKEPIPMSADWVEWQVIRVKLCFGGLIFAPLFGYVYALLMRQDATIRASITDDQLPDYERETLAAIRAANPWVERMSTKVLKDAWEAWSVQTAGGRWRSTNPDNIRAFLSWAFTRPIDRF